MRPVAVDKLFVGGLSAAATVCTASLVVLWSLHFDAAGTSVLRVPAAMALAIWLTARLPGKAARLLQRLLGAMNVAEVRSVELALGAVAPVGRQELTSLMRLLAAAAALTAAGGLLSVGAVYLAAGVKPWLARHAFAWDPAVWAVLKLLIETAGLVPLAAGVCLTFLVTLLIRRGSGRDLYASVFREWLAGAAAGLALAAGLWWTGADALGVAVVSAVALLAGGGVVIQRGELTVRPRRTLPPVASPSSQLARRAWIAACFAALAAGLAIQMRLLRDVYGIGLGGQALWVAASLWGLLRFVTVADAKSRPPGEAQGLGATVGVLFGFVLQCSLAFLGLTGGGIAVVAALLAAGAQAPLLAMAAVLISRHRRTFAIAGGLAREYLALAGLGLAGGWLAYMAAGAASAAVPVGAVAALAGLVAAAVRCIARARRRGEPVRWAALGAVLVCSAGAAPLLALRGRPDITAGVWLTASAGSSRADPGAAAAPGVLCGSGWRSEAITARLRRMLASRGGVWRVVAACAADIPDRLPEEMVLSPAHPDPTATRGLDVAGAAGTWRSLPDAVELETQRFDGLLLSPLAADHPEAWRCYAPGVLARCAAALHRRGVLIVRARARDAGTLVSVAASFARQVPSGRAVLDVRGGAAELLLAGPRPYLLPPPTDDALVTVPLATFFERAGRRPPRRLGGRGWLLSEALTPAELLDRLTRGREKGKPSDDFREPPADPRD